MFHASSSPESREVGLVLSDLFTFSTWVTVGWDEASLLTVFFTCIGLLLEPPPKNEKKEIDWKREPYSLLATNVQCLKPKQASILVTNLPDNVDCRVLFV